MAEELHQKRCIPCEGNVPPLTKEEAENLLSQVDGWELSPEGTSIWKSYTFKDFAQTMKFVDGIAKVAEEEGHHPDLHISYDSLEIELSTHAIGGLSENDFILASKVDRIKH